MSEDAAVQARKTALVSSFSRSAPDYDQVGPRFFSYFGERLADLTPILPGSRGLDLATGRGAVLWPVAQKVGLQGAVVGVDLADGMVEQTEREVKARKLANVEVFRMDAEQLTFPDASFDFVVCGFGLFFFPQLRAALAEVYRVLKPDGWLAASSWGAPDERWNWIAEVGLRPKRQGHGERVAHGGNREWLLTPLAENGFVSERIVEEEAEFTFTNEDEWWASEWSHGARSCLERLDPQSLEEAKHAAYQRLQAFKQPNGIPHLYRVVFTFAQKPE